MTDNYCIETGLFLVGLIPNLICFIITIPIALISIKRMQKLIRTTDKKVRITFYIVCIICIFVTTICVVDTITCTDYGKPTTLILAIFSNGLYFMLTFALLCILLLRVHIAFKHSIYQLTSCQNGAVSVYIR